MNLDSEKICKLQGENLKEYIAYMCNIYTICKKKTGMLDLYTKYHTQMHTHNISITKPVYLLYFVLLG